MIVRPASRMLSAISFGVFWRSAPLDQRDHAVEEGLARARAVMRTLIQSEMHLRAAGDRRAIAAGFRESPARIRR